MTAKEAAEILKNKFENKIIVECLCFADFYAFALSEKGNETKDFGGGYYTINKKNGSMSTFNPTENLKAFFAAERVDIKTLT